MIRWCTVPEIWCVTDEIVISHFGLLFALLPPNCPKNQNFEKMRKKPGDIIILHRCTKNYDQTMYSSWDMLRDRRTDGQMDGQKKWHIEVGAPPKKLLRQEKLNKVLENRGKMLNFHGMSYEVHFFSEKISLVFGFTFDLLNSIYECTLV